MVTRIVQANRAVSPTENQPQHHRIHWGSPWRSDALKNSIFSDFDSSDGIFAEHRDTKGASYRRNLHRAARHATIKEVSRSSRNCAPGNLPSCIAVRYPRSA